MNVRINIPVADDGLLFNAGVAGQVGKMSRPIKKLVQSAAEAIDRKALKPPSPAAMSPGSQAGAVLELLVTCYLHQVYSSRNVSERAARDPDFQWFWWEDFPDASSLRRFREENSDAVHQCLTTALQLLAQEHKKFAGTLNKINGPQLAREASRRITMAAFVDTMELERA